MKKAKAVLSSLLAALFLTCCLPLTAIPIAAQDLAGFAGGTGADNDPYLIQTAAQLDQMRDDLDAHYQLIGNIALPQDTVWQPVGTEETPFTGSLDGNGFTISGLTLSYSGNQGETIYAGLFGVLQGQVENLSLTQAAITGNTRISHWEAGLLAGRMEEAAVTNSTFDGAIDLTTTGSANGDGSVQAGLMAGEMENSTISGCTTSGSITTQGDHGSANAGGITGSALGCTISGCTNRGDVSVVVSGTTISAQAGAAGIVSDLRGDTQVNDCHNYGSITSHGNALANGGGIAATLGDSASDGSLTGCTNAGTIDVYVGGQNYAAYGGGIAGQSRGDIADCHNTGSVHVSDRSRASLGGGIVGLNAENATISGCSNTGDVTVEGNLSDSSFSMDYAGISYAGGLAGLHDGSSKIEGCWNSGSVHCYSNWSSSIAGGLCGSVSINATVENAFNTGSVSAYQEGDSSYSSSAGGIVGHNGGNDNPDLLHCYSIGRVYANDSWGTKIGSSYFSSNSDCYALGDGRLNVRDGGYIQSSNISYVSQTPEEMEQQSTYTAFDFDTVWQMGDGASYPYPTLRDNPYIAPQEDTTRFAGGSGMPYDPYLIATAAQLNNLRQELGAYFRLTADIVFTDRDFAFGGPYYNAAQGWDPIGEDLRHPFFGMLEGNNYSISGLKLTPAGENARYLGLFGALSGTVTDLYLTNLTLNTITSYSGDEYETFFIGGLAGNSYNSLLKNVTVSGSISAQTTGAETGLYLGGLVGSSIGRHQQILSCTNHAAVQGSSQRSLYLGGIAGASNTSLLENSANTGALTVQDGSLIALGGLMGNTSESDWSTAVTGSSNRGSLVANSSQNNYLYIGGLIGFNGGADISGSFNAGSLTAQNTWTTQEDVTKNSRVYAGGISGQQQGNSALTDSYNTGSVFAASAASNVSVGGIYGLSYYALEAARCWNSGTVSGQAALYSYVGGVAGYGANLTDCYNTGNVSVSGSQSYTYLGGVAGRASNNLTGCYNLGSLSAENVNQSWLRQGSITGDREAGTISGCYYLDTTGAAIGNNPGSSTVTPLTQQQFTQQESFPDLDFTETWTMEGHPTYAYPELTSNPMVLERNLTRLVILSQPVKTTYVQGQALDLTGLQVQAQYSDGTSQIITNYAVSGYDSSTVGTQRITLTYEGQTASFTIMVQSLRIDHLELTPPDTLEYYQGYELDLTGMELVACYNNGDRQTVSDSQYTVSGFDSSLAGTQTITVSYQGLTASFTVTVHELVLEQLAFDSYPDKMEYFVGEELDLTGLEVVGLYNDGSRRPIADYTVSGYDPQQPGSQRIVISYQGVSYHFWIEVREASDLPGDYNNDGQVDVTDAMTLAQYLCDGSVSISQSADYNGDGEANVLDVMALLQQLANPA